MKVRVGQGFDIHPFSDDPSRPLILAGVRVDGRGLRGHSDADVVCHAVADALLGAAGMGDIGPSSPIRIRCGEERTACYCWRKQSNG